MESGDERRARWGVLKSVAEAILWRHLLLGLTMGLLVLGGAQWAVPPVLLMRLSMPPEVAVGEVVPYAVSGFKWRSCPAVEIQRKWYGAKGAVADYAEEVYPGERLKIGNGRLIGPLLVPQLEPGRYFVVQQTIYRGFLCHHFARTDPFPVTVHPAGKGPRGTGLFGTSLPPPTAPPPVTVATAD